MSEVLVTGGLGFIGSNLAEALLEEGNKVTIVDNGSRSTRKSVPGAKLYNLDVQDNINHLVSRADYVYHLAALARVRPSLLEPVKYHETNVNGTLNVLDACRKFGKKIIFSSSSSVFGDSNKAFIEDTEYAPKNPYALQKMMGELYIKLYGQLYDQDYTILRYFNVYGPGQILGGAYSTVMGTFLDQESRGQPLTIFGDGEQRRDFTHIRDVTRANLLAREHSGVFNVGRGSNVSVNEVAQMISSNTVNLPPIEGEAKITLCNNTKAKNVMGWTPEIDVTKDIMVEMSGE